MLTELAIRDFAIIQQLTLELEAGMTVLTGETGAGKSIILDALKLATGERADTSMVRHGAERAEIVARFDPANSESVRALLASLELDSSEELLLRRVVTADGRSRAYVNDIPCPVGRLREIGDLLVEIHGQHEHYQLLRADHQLALVDAAGDHRALLDELAGTYRQWRKSNEALAQLRSDAALSEGERDLIRYQIEELEPLVDAARDIDALHERHRRLAASQELMQTCDGASTILNDEVGERLAELAQELRRAARIDETLGEARDLVDGALIQAQEAAQALNRYLRTLVDEDDEALDTLDRSLSQVHDLARKHRVEAAALPQRLSELTERLERAEAAESSEAKLERDVQALEQQYLEQAALLHTARHSAAEALSAEITTLMAQLGMKDGRFEAQVSHEPEGRRSAEGLDSVSFMVTANPGQPLRPLARVASGGELSRIGLAIKVALSDRAASNTMVFDEVDSGVGGAVAEIVGDKLRALASGRRQVFCVTHLPQVACRGHHHLRVEKQIAGGQTLTLVTALDAEDRVSEVARMLGGKEITDRSMAHAQEMLGLADRPGPVASGKAATRR